MLARKPRMLVAVALANRMARIVWALTTKQVDIQRENADSRSYIRVEFKDLAHVLPTDNYPTQLESALAA